MAKDKPLTQQEFARQGSKAQKEKYPKEVRAAWARKGFEKVKEKYGEDYFKEFSKKGIEARRKKKEAQEKAQEIVS